MVPGPSTGATGRRKRDRDGPSHAARARRKRKVVEISAPTAAELTQLTASNETVEPANGIT